MNDLFLSIFGYDEYLQGTKSSVNFNEQVVFLSYLCTVVLCPHDRGQSEVAQVNRLVRRSMKGFPGDTYHILEGFFSFPAIWMGIENRFQ